MVQASKTLDSTFHALANSTRRSIIEQLVSGPATVSELAEPFDMALPSFMEHLQALESCGLVRSEKRGRVRTVRSCPEKLSRVSEWLLLQQGIWNQRLDQLDDYLKTMEE